MSKLGKRDLFSPSVERSPSSARPKGRTADESEVEKVMVMLAPHQVHALDRICLEIRQSTGIKMKRSMLIRSFIDGLLQARLNYESAETPEDIHQIIAEAVHAR